MNSFKFPGETEFRRPYKMPCLQDMTKAHFMKLNLFNTVKNEEHWHGQRSVIWIRRSHPSLRHLHVLSTLFFLAATLFVQPLNHSFTPIPPPFIFPLINQCDRCLVPLAWGLMAGGCRFASNGGVTLSRGWLCQKWKPLDIPGTHLH